MSTSFTLCIKEGIPSVPLQRWYVLPVLHLLQVNQLCCVGIGGEALSSCLGDDGDGDGDDGDGNTADANANDNADADASVDIDSDKDEEDKDEEDNDVNNYSDVEDDSGATEPVHD